MKLMNRILRLAGVQMAGEPRFIAKSVRFDDFSRITLGDRLVASMNVYFLTHDYSYTTALISIAEIPETDVGVLRDIKIGNNVFIGMNSIILPGAEIGNNVIIGAGSVIRGKIPDNSIVSGNPAQITGNIQTFAEKIKSRKHQNLRIDKQ